MTIRWGIIGCGDVARKRVAAAIQSVDGCELVSVCRRDQQQLGEFRRDFNVPRGSTSADDLINDPEIDALYLATPVHLHCPHTIAAARTGKHVLVEKPMAMNVAECDTMIETCHRHDVRLGVAFYRPFYPVIARMQELIGRGVIGQVMSVTAVTSTPFAISPGEDGYWRVIPEHGGGGALMDIGSHRLDLFVRMFGPVTEVKAVRDTVAADYRVEDMATAILQFASGAHGLLHCVFGSTVDPDEFSILGTCGRLVSSPLNSGNLRIERVGAIDTELHPPCSNFNLPLIADFATAIREGRTALVSGEQGREVNRLMALAYASAGH